MELPLRERLRKHAGIEQTEKIPLGTGFSLEVPEDPAVGESLVDIQLCLDELPRVVLKGLIPCIDEIDTAARPVVRAARIITLVAGANAITIESGGAVRHRSRPFPNYHPVVDIGRVCTRVTAGELAVLSR